VAFALLTDRDEKTRVRRRIAIRGATWPERMMTAMHLAKLVLGLGTSALVALFTAGCAVTVEGPPTPVPVEQPASMGSLTVRWLVAGTTSASVCEGYRASTLHLAVFDANGRRAATTDAPCESFAVSLSLPEGTYTADAMLVDVNGRAVSTTKTLRAIEVVSGTDLAIDLDFPAASML
jgi:hypothetical protein